MPEYEPEYEIEKIEREYREEERAITECLLSLPSERLKVLCKTVAQIQCWTVNRAFQVWVAACWHARFKGKEDPIRDLLESETLNKITYDRCWRTVDYYEQFWGLIQLAFRDIQLEFEKMGEKLPFKTSRALFEYIISDEVNANFSVCLEPYREVSGRKYEKAYRLVAQHLKRSKQFTPDEKKEASAVLLNHSGPNLWMTVVIIICNRKATGKNRALKSKLKMFDLAQAQLCLLEATIRREAGSFAWKDGEQLRGSRYGGTYETP